MFKILNKSSLLSLVVVFSILSGCNKGSDDNKVTRSAGPDPSVGQLGLSCNEFLNTLGDDYVFESVEVPEDYKKPFGLKIAVGYFRPKVLTQKVAVFFNGGPGGDSHSSLEILEQSLKAKNIKDQISIIYLDQRGNGCSSEYPVSDTLDITYLERLTHYGSSDIVKDAEVVRQKLIGNSKWIVFGQSYGGLIVHRYVADFPGSLSKALAHAGSISLNSYERNLSRITAQVQVWQMFAQSYPEAYKRFKVLYSFLSSNKNYCLGYSVGEQRIRQCGIDIIDELGIMSFLGFNKWARLDNFLKKIVSENGEFNTTAMADRLKLMYEETTAGYNLAMTVIGIVDRGVESMTASRCLSMYAEIKKNIQLNGNDFFTECSSSIQHNFEEGERKLQLKENLRPFINLVTVDKLKIGISQMSAKSFFIYSGARDTFVPAGSIQPELKFIISDVNYTHFANSGHDGFYSEDQVLQDLVK